MKKKTKKKIDISAKEACFYFNNVLLNSKHCLLIPAMEPGSYNVANRNMSPSCINLPLNSEKQKGLRSHDVTQNCQMTPALCPKTGGNYTRNKPAGRSDQPQIIYSYSQSTD